MKTARQAAGVHRRLDDFPTFVAERSKRSDLSASLRVVEERITEARRSLTRLPDSKTEVVAEAAKQFLAGSDLDALLKERPSDRASILVLIEELNFRRDVIRSAIFEQDDIVGRVKSECAHEIFKEVRPEHKRLMSEILDHVVALSDALEAEYKFRRQMEAEGVALSGAPQVSDLAHKIGFCTQWGGYANDIWRRVSDYIGRPWDHSKVTR